MMTEHQDASSAQQIILTFEIAPENTRDADDAMVNAVGHDTIEALSKDGGSSHAMRNEMSQASN